MDWSKDWTKEENWHEYAKLLPLANKDDFARIVKGIRQKGLRHKIVLFEGKILDGRNRALACAENGITLTDNHFVQFDPNEEGISALEYVITENLEERQLTWDQQCAVAAEIVPLLAEKAKQRQTDAGERGAEGGRGHKKTLAEKPAEGFEEFGKSAAQAAASFPGISTSAVERIIALEKAAPGTRDKIKHGQITIRQAEKEVAKHPRNKLKDLFVAPPFSFLDPTADYWKDRKAEWASIFDPVLCECMIRWFAPTTGGHILDPFAGGSTRGIVAAHLGYQYTGVEWRPGQAEINTRQAETVRVVHPSLHAPIWLQEWIQPGGPHINLPETEDYDMVFTSAPLYSGSQADISTWGTYLEFVNWWASICGQAVARLKENRFVIVAVEELTDKDGIIRAFIEHNKVVFEQLRLAYYNRMVLRTYPEMPKWTETEQQIFATFPACRAVEILCFWKGEAKELARLHKHIGVIQDASKTPITKP